MAGIDPELSGTSTGAGSSGIPEFDSNAAMDQATKNIQASPILGMSKRNDMILQEYNNLRQQYLDDTKYQRAMADLDKAGINRQYLFGGSPASAASNVSSNPSTSAGGAKVAGSLIAALAKILGAVITAG